MKQTLLGITLLLILSSCQVSRNNMTVRKLAPEDLQEDYALFRQILESNHPSLYWYSSKQEMDQYFEWGATQLKDSLTERNFRKVLSYVYAGVHCGHSTIRASRRYNRLVDSLRQLSFPLRVKIWEDTTVITFNLHRQDSILQRGTPLLSIDGQSLPSIVDTLSKFISSDGYSSTHKWQSLSTGANFGTLYTTVFGIKNQYRIEYLDTNGVKKERLLPVYDPRKDTGFRRLLPRFQPPSRSEIKEQARLSSRQLVYGDPDSTAYLTLNSFNNGFGLKRFFRSSFREFRKKGTRNLVIDVRGNGGGNVGNSTLLTKFIANQPFRLADSLYAIRKGSRYGKYIQHHFFNQLFLSFFTRKRSDGHYHFGYYEKHVFKPKKKNRFRGQVYILTGGNSFSATTLFAGILRDQSNVLIVGEETGGAAYGNSAWLIPDVTLPHSKVRFRLPLFRLVTHPTKPKDGKGVQPEWFAGPTVDAVRQGIDYKMEVVKELIRSRRAW